MSNIFKLVSRNENDNLVGNDIYTYLYTKGLWPSNSGTLLSFNTSSVQNSKSKEYYIQVWQSSSVNTKENEDKKQQTKKEEPVESIKKDKKHIIDDINKKLELKNDEDGFKVFYEKKKIKVEEAYPELTSDEVLKKLKKKWKNLPQDKKDKYIY